MRRGGFWNTLEDVAASLVMWALVILLSVGVVILAAVAAAAWEAIL